MRLTNRDIGEECTLNVWKSHVISMSMKKRQLHVDRSRRPTPHHPQHLAGERVLIAFRFNYIRCFEAGLRRLHSALVALAEQGPAALAHEDVSLEQGAPT